MCEQVKSVRAKLEARAKKEKDGRGGNFVDIFCSGPNFCVVRILSTTHTEY